ncbi:MAG: Gfo/Idh/MocA family oxidoreductase [Patescibacteria group bacterium]|nr:Gfo/Idh/MocA family oxidoreductase [Patescibacteria group bacterium]
MSRKLNRRTFISRSLHASVAVAGAAAIGGPAIVPSSVFGLDGATAPSNRITMGLIGCGSHGRGWNMDRMFENPQQQILAVCDVDQAFMTEARQKVDAFYSQKAGSGYKACAAYGDFRDLVNRKDIDAVAIVTPDHWHVLMSVFAMKAGKDVICEKPTLTIAEGRLLSDVQKATARVYQTASENRSIDSFQYMVNAVRGGHLGELRHVKVLLPPGNRRDRDPNKARQDTSFQVTEAPAHLDYEKWLGPAPLKPYVAARVHYNWRWNFDYSGGVLTDWASHLVNLAQWANDADETGPIEVRGTGHFPDFGETWNTAETFDIRYRYANGVTLHVWSEVPGIKLEGTKGWIMMRGWRQDLRASDDSLLGLSFDGEENLGRPESTVKNRGGGGGEHVDFTHCVKSRQLCYYSAECGHRNHTISHMGNISMLLGGAKLAWNPQTEKFEGERAEEANGHFCYARPQREPWTFDRVDSWINVG